MKEQLLQSKNKKAEGGNNSAFCPVILKFPKQKAVSETLLTALFFKYSLYLNIMEYKTTSIQKA